jgi:putative ABC transport system permease protein
VAGGLAVVIDALIPPGSIPLDVTGARVLTSAALLLAAAVIGCGFSLRRVLHVDPAAAIGTAS